MALHLIGVRTCNRRSSYSVWGSIKSAPVGYPTDREEKAGKHGKLYRLVGFFRLFRDAYPSKQQNVSKRCSFPSSGISAGQPEGRGGTCIYATVRPLCRVSGSLGCEPLWCGIQKWGGPEYLSHAGRRKKNTMTIVKNVGIYFSLTRKPLNEAAYWMAKYVSLPKSEFFFSSMLHLSAAVSDSPCRVIHVNALLSGRFGREFIFGCIL